MDVPSDDLAGLRLRATIQVSNDIGRHTEVVLHVRCHGTLTCTILQAYQVKAWIEIEDCDDFDNDDNLCRYTYSKDWTGAPQDPLTFKFPESCSSKVQSQLSQIELRGCVPGDICLMLCPNAAGQQWPTLRAAAVQIQILTSACKRIARVLSMNSSGGHKYWTRLWSSHFPLFHETDWHVSVLMRKKSFLSQPHSVVTKITLWQRPSLTYVTVRLCSRLLGGS